MFVECAPLLRGRFSLIASRKGMTLVGKLQKHILVSLIV